MASVNAFTFVSFPTFMIHAEPGAPNYLVYALVNAGVTLGAGLFTFLAVLALEGILIAALPYRVFQSVSAPFQLAILFGLLFMFVLAPSGTPEMLRDPASETARRLLPTYWFLGLYQELLGTAHPAVGGLAGMARSGLLLAAVLALALYTIGYAKTVRKVLEEPDLTPGGREPLWSRPADMAVRLLCRTPVEAAVFRFTGRTLVRNKRNRLVLAVCLSVGLGYMLGDVASAIRSGGGKLHTPSAALAGLSMVLVFFALLGMRVLFTMPVELKANWIFQITEAGSVREYARGARRAMLALGAAPVCAFATPVYALLWGWQPALLHLMVLALLSLILTEQLLLDFPKLPFTCSFLPGKANLKTNFAWYAILFAALTFVVTNLEAWALRRPKPLLVLCALAAGYLGLLIFERRPFERVPTALLYEEKPEIILTLGLGA